MNPRRRLFLRQRDIEAAKIAVEATAIVEEVEPPILVSEVVTAAIEPLTAIVEPELIPVAAKPKPKRVRRAKAKTTNKPTIEVSKPKKVARTRAKRATSKKE
tara:strand:- start:613 stop:918 length:306 start_codon:yes stop_codon:yes gene_type:complete